MKKLGILMLLPLVLISCGPDKKDTEEVVQEKIKETPGVIKKVDENTSETSKPEEDVKKKDSTSDLANSIYSKDGKNIGERIKLLTTTYNESKDVDVLKQITYLNSFAGNYTEHKKHIEDICKENKELPMCIKDNFDITVSYPTDTEGDALEDLTMSINGETVGPLKGKMDYEGYGNTFYRIKVSKKGYTDFFKRYNSIKDYGDKSNELGISINPVLLEAEVKKKLIANTEAEVKTTDFEYKIGKNSFTDKDGKKVTGAIEVYFFNITPEDQDNGNLNVLTQDAFDNDGKLVGTAMITHGMPLVKAYKGNEELKINEPIIGSGTMMASEKAENMDLDNVPKNVWLNKGKLDKYNIPPFWNLSKEGVWHEAEMMILNNDGDYKFKLGL